MVRMTYEDKRRIARRLNGTDPKNVFTSKEWYVRKRARARKVAEREAIAKAYAADRRAINAG